MGSMQCNVEFGYQPSICSGTKENIAVRYELNLYMLYKRKWTASVV
jgi:hypothetical protein